MVPPSLRMRLRRTGMGLSEYPPVPFEDPIDQVRCEIQMERKIHLAFHLITLLFSIVFAIVVVLEM